MHTRVKICGITRVEDALASITAGADAIGLVFDRNSSRCITLDHARAIVQVLPPFVTVVGLFVDADTEQVRETIRRVRPTLLQFHGDETPEQCRLYEMPFVKAIRMRDNVDVPDQAHRYADARALVLDTYVLDQPGGSGQVFDWSRIPNSLNKPIVLAGGLNQDNVGEAIKKARPYAVDVSSGVERDKGIKDRAKLNAFIAAVRRAE